MLVLKVDIHAKRMARTVVKNNIKHLPKNPIEICTDFKIVAQYTISKSLSKRSYLQKDYLWGAREFGHHLWSIPFLVPQDSQMCD